MKPRLWRIWPLGKRWKLSWNATRLAIEAAESNWLSQVVRWSTAQYDMLNPGGYNLYTTQIWKQWWSIYSQALGSMSRWFKYFRILFKQLACWMCWLAECKTNSLETCTLFDFFAKTCQQLTTDGQAAAISAVRAIPLPFALMRFGTCSPVYTGMTPEWSGMYITDGLWEAHSIEDTWTAGCKAFWFIVFWDPTLKMSRPHFWEYWF